jgi:hypothetical protein
MTLPIEAGALDTDVAASRAEHRFESEDAIESLAQVLEAFKMGLDSD